MSDKKDQSVASLKKEITQLKKEISKLKAEQQTASINDNLNDFANGFSESVASTNREIGNEVARLIRSYSDAATKLCSELGDLNNVANDELNKQAEANNGEDAVQNLNNLPTHLYNAYIKALNESAKIPANVVSTFNDSYQSKS